jgi:hypothetical protein
MPRGGDGPWPNGKGVCEMPAGRFLLCESTFWECHIGDRRRAYQLEGQLLDPSQRRDMMPSTPRPPFSSIRDMASCALPAAGAIIKFIV